MTAQDRDVHSRLGEPFQRDKILKSSIWSVLGIMVHWLISVQPAQTLSNAIRLMVWRKDIDSRSM